MDNNNSQNPNSNQNPMQNNNDTLIKALTPISIVVGCIVIAVALFLGLRSSKSNDVAGPNVGTGNQNPQTQNVNIKNVSTQGEPFIGNANAPVTMAYYSDYQCPFCKQFETTTFTQIVKNYVNTGKVKVIFKDFEFLGPDSTADALYARSVWALYPNQYFAWRTAMFDTQPQENSLSTADNNTRLQKITASISGIDAKKVAADVAAHQDIYQKQIDADMTEGTSFGVQGTPSFIIGTQLFSGGSSYSQFTQLFDAQLK